MTLSPLGGSGKTYRLADNLTTDYQDFSEIQDLWENTVVSDQMLMEIVAASDETMGNHARTPFVMDAVSLSDTALDAIWQSDLAWDTVKTLAMAVGKFVAGRAGLDGSNYADIDAVASDQSAMDAVSTSSTAMDAVSASTLARTAAIGSQYAIDSIWSIVTGSETWLDGFQTQTESSFQSLVAGPTADGSALEIDIRNSASTASSRGWTVDPENYSNLEWKDRVPVSNYYSGDTYIRVKVNGDTIYSKTYSNSTQDAWTSRSVDISTYSAETDIVVMAETKGDSNSYITAQFGDIILS